MLGVAGRAASAVEQLDTWMAEDERHAEPAFYGTARAGIRFQPKGVVGNIVPWNFPFDLSVGPLVEMLAAGNRVIIKPSDYTPACADLLRRMVSETFPEDRVAVSVGGLTLAKEFPTLRWDHLLYTGSPEIGREVARAAAGNLVPVTLELGGKCPAILAADSVDADSVRSVIGTKLIKNGQMCISVDYALVPRAQVDDFVAHAEHYLTGELPDYASSADCTGIITERHLERIVTMVDEARAAGARVVSLGGEGDLATRRMPLVLVIDPPKGLRIMQEEIFGPILPVIPYDDLDEALAEVNAGERPLGLYVFSKDTERRRACAAPDDLGRCVRQHLRRPGRAAVAGVRRDRAERQRPAPRDRGIPRVLQPARRGRARDGRPGRRVPAAVRAGGAGHRRQRPRRGARRRRRARQRLTGTRCTPTPCTPALCTSAACRASRCVGPGRDRVRSLRGPRRAVGARRQAPRHAGPRR